jgi:hypothetical protein
VNKYIPALIFLGRSGHCFPRDAAGRIGLLESLKRDTLKRKLVKCWRTQHTSATLPLVNAWVHPKLHANEEVATIGSTHGLNSGVARWRL